MTTKQAHPQSVLVRLMTSSLAVLVLCVASCARGGVEHPSDGGKGTVEYCQSGAAEEQNCMACSSKPGCGYCSVPRADAPVCQPGLPGDDAPDTCIEPLVTSTTQCPGPPPPVD